MKYLFGTALAAAAIGLSAAATAADAPVYLKAPPAPVWSWTGMYLGWNAGGGWAKTPFYDIYPTEDLASDGNPRLNGAFGGVQAGYRHQFNWVVVGIQGDYDFSGIGSHFNCFSFGNQVCDSKKQWFATLTASLGIALTPQALVYVKGGGAAVRDHFSDLATAPGSSGGVNAFPGVLFEADETRLGYVVGAGFEYAITHNWSAFIEYNYMNFGSHHVEFTGENGGIFPELIKQQLEVVKLGVNYKLDWGVTPVSALGYADSGSGRSSSYPKALTKGEPEGPAYHILAFSGVDFTTRNSADTWLGALIAPTTDLDHFGPRIYVNANGGYYKYLPGRFATAKITGTYEGADLLGGWGLEGNNYSVNLLGGANVENQHESVLDPTNPDRGTRAGFKLHADAWINPTAQTLIYNEGEYSTAFNAYYVASKLGFDVFGKEIFFGPEIAAMGDNRYDQGRVGVHFTQITVGTVHIGVAGGFMHDTSVGNGGYGTLEFDTNF
jgi:outer membrane immunogenic protein